MKTVSMEKCTGTCGKDLAVVTFTRGDGRTGLALQATQSHGTYSVMNADGTWSYYCRSCFMNKVLTFLKGKIVEER